MSAVFSEGRMYRYRLDRILPRKIGRTVAFIGINPSKANEVDNDATLRKLMTFAYQFGAARFTVRNVFAYCATDVNELAMASDPSGPYNRKVLDQIYRDADLVILMWGSRMKVPERLRTAIAVERMMLNDHNRPLKCFGLTKLGDPRHPLMLPYSTPLEEFVP